MSFDQIVDFLLHLQRIDDDDGVVIPILALVWVIFFGTCLIQFFQFFQSKDSNEAIAAALARKKKKWSINDKNTTKNFIEID